MADSIIVNVSELRSRLQDIRRSGMEYVELTICDSEEIQDDVLPPCIGFSGCKAVDPDTWVDFDDVDAVDNEAEFKKRSSAGVHMSDTML